MPTKYILVLAKSTEDHPLFPYEHWDTRVARFYTDMSDREYFQRRDEYYEFHPAAKHKSWRQHLEDLADDDFGTISEAEYEKTMAADIAHWRRCRRIYSPSSGPRVADEDDISQGSGRGRFEYSWHQEEDIADRISDIDIGGRSSQRDAKPSESRALVPHQRNPYDEEYQPESSEDAYSDHGGPWAGRRDSTGSGLPLLGYSGVSMSPNRSRRGPQPSAQPDHGGDRLSGGRYNAGVRALRSPDTPRRSARADDEKAHSSKGRYNMGVRAPRSQDGPSRQGSVRADRAPQAIDSVFSRLEEEKPASGRA